jgi:photosystem II stability/assembly factor-like uncharacterized protein
MKIITLIFLLLIIFYPRYLKSQTQNSSYDPNCGIWRVSGNMTGTNTRQGDDFTWQMVQTPVDYQILRVFFVDLMHGWAGHNGNGGLRTTDGGFNWNTISFNDTNFSTLYNGCYFLDQNTGWMVGGALQIRKTTDGGVTWFKQYAPPAAGIFHSITFFDANTGIAIGSKNFPYVPFIAKSTNAGNNWVELPDVFSGAQELNNQYWFNSSTGWISGYNVLLYSTNGGQSFVNLFSNVPPTGNGFNDLLSVWFVNQQTGWIGGSNLDKKNIYITTNAGANWIFQDNPVSQNNSFVQINDIAFLTPDSGWAIHGTPFSGDIMFTTNAGTNWVIENGSNYWFQCISVYDHSKAWVGASSGTVWYSVLSSPQGILHNYNNVPHKFSLAQNYPNPFNPGTIISYQIPTTNDVKIILYDAMGRELKTLVDKQQIAGSHKIEFDGTDFPSGVYFYKLIAGSFNETKKMILIK